MSHLLDERYARTDALGAVLSAEEEAPILALDVGSSRVACGVGGVRHGRPVLATVEVACAYGLREGEVVDLPRARESLGIVARAVRATTPGVPRAAVVGYSGAARLCLARGSFAWHGGPHTVSRGDVRRLRRTLYPETGPASRTVQRFDGPYGVGALEGVEDPVGLAGTTLALQSSFLTAPAERLEHLWRAVRGAGLGLEQTVLTPLACSLGATTADERLLGVAVLDFGAGGFRGALWEGGRLRQLTVSNAERSPTGVAPAAGGMEGVVVELARRFRIAPQTARRLLASVHTPSPTLPAGGEGALPPRAGGARGGAGKPEGLRLLSSTSADAPLAVAEDAQAPAALRAAEARPPFVEVASVNGLDVVSISLPEFSAALEEVLTPAIRGLRDGLSLFSASHSGGVVLAGQGARRSEVAALVSRHFSGAPVRVGQPRWETLCRLPGELEGPGGCTLAGLFLCAAEERRRVREERRRTWWGRFLDDCLGKAALW